MRKEKQPVLETDVMTLPELCAFLRISPSTAYRMAEARRLPAFKIGRDWRFERSAINYWMAAEVHRQRWRRQ